MGGRPERCQPPPLRPARIAAPDFVITPERASGAGLAYIQAGIGLRHRAMEEQHPAAEDDGIPLIEGWMLGVLLFREAMAKIEQVPPANDADPP